ncbi:MAG: hypothetical protein E7660_07125, partial [Ruminococcaceae bacterium]|nr:hypothetical protein [Oscillospiraceae bacterium]
KKEAPVPSPKAYEEKKAETAGLFSSIMAGYDMPDFSKAEKKAEDSVEVEAPEAPKTEAPKAEEATEKKEYKVALASKESDTEDEVPDFKIIGEAYNCYVMVELEDRILMIDKHAAHERILFDELCERRRRKEKESQILLVPIEVVMLSDDMTVLEEYSEDIRSVGFGFDTDLSKNTVSISKIPSEIGTESAADMFATMVSRLSEGMGTVESTEAEFFEKALYQASCKAAIKGGRYYGVDHVKWICRKLLKKPDENGKVIKTCPHGRPVAFEIKKTSIERQFSRLE